MDKSKLQNFITKKFPQSLHNITKVTYFENFGWFMQKKNVLDSMNIKHINSQTNKIALYRVNSLILSPQIYTATNERSMKSLSMKDPSGN